MEGKEGSRRLQERREGTKREGRKRGFEREGKKLGGDLASRRRGGGPHCRKERMGGGLDGDLHWDTIGSLSESPPGAKMVGEPGRCAVVKESPRGKVRGGRSEPEPICLAGLSL